MWPSRDSYQPRIFRQRNAQYYHCCGNIHVTQLAMVIVLIWTVLLMFELAYLSLTPENPAFWRELFVLVVQTVVLLVFVAGIQRRNDSLFLPFIVMEVIVIIVWSMVIFLGAVALLDFDEFSFSRKFFAEVAQHVNQVLGEEGRQLHFNAETMASILIFQSALMIALQVWVIWVVLRCSKYFTEIRHDPNAALIFFPASADRHNGLKTPYYAYNY